MKFLKHCTVWMLLVCVLFCFAACKEQQEQRDERELSVFELTYSQELRDEVLEAQSRWKIEQYGYDDNEIPWEFNTNVPGSLVSSGYRYYGTFDDCIVWFIGGDVDGFTEFYLGEAYFHHYKGARFYVCRNGVHMTLQEAYEQSLISDADVAIVAERHKAYNDEVNTPKKTS